MPHGNQAEAASSFMIGLRGHIGSIQPLSQACRYSSGENIDPPLNGKGVKSIDRGPHVWEIMWESLENTNCYVSTPWEGGMHAMTLCSMLFPWPRAVVWLLPCMLQSV